MTNPTKKQNTQPERVMVRLDGALRAPLLRLRAKKEQQTQRTISLTHLVEELVKKGMEKDSVELA